MRKTRKDWVHQINLYDYFVTKVFWENHSLTAIRVLDHFKKNGYSHEMSKIEFYNQYMNVWNSLMISTIKDSYQNGAKLGGRQFRKPIKQRFIVNHSGKFIISYFLFYLEESNIQYRKFKIPRKNGTDEVIDVFIKNKDLKHFRQFDEFLNI